MYKSISLIFAATLAILFAASTGQSQGDDSAGLIPDESVGPLDVDTRFSVRPTKCRNVGRDCMAGEFLAIYKSDNPSEGNIKTAVKNFLLSLVGSPVTFTDVKATRLDKPPGTQTYDVCGQILLRIQFTPTQRVNEAMQFVWDQLHNAGTPDPLVNKDTVLGIQPFGVGRPSPSQIPEQYPGPVADATLRIGSKELPPLGQILPKVTVAILDTGWTNTPGTEGAKVNVANSLAWDVSNIDSLPVKGLALDNFFDPISGASDLGIGHGTPIASIIGSSNKSIGVAPNAEIVPIKICNDTGQCKETSAIYGACYAMSPTVRASVLNMSFAGRTMVPDAAGYHAPIFEGLINDATRAGSLVVAAAGNSRDPSFKGSSNEPLYPGILSSGYGPKPKDKELSPPMRGTGMLSVGATYNDLNYAAFATYHNRVDLTAPGSWVRVIGKDGNIKSSSSNPPVNVSGTSLSTAYVSGAAALIIGHKASLPTPVKLTAIELARLIVKYANVGGCAKVWTDPFSNWQCGNGLLDVYEAWNDLRP
jgi:Subtilase family